MRCGIFPEELAKHHLMKWLPIIAREELPTGAAADINLVFTEVHMLTLQSGWESVCGERDDCRSSGCARSGCPDGKDRRHAECFLQALPSRSWLALSWDAVEERGRFSRRPRETPRQGRSRKQDVSVRSSCARGRWTSWGAAEHQQGASGDSRRLR